MATKQNRNGGPSIGTEFRAVDEKGRLMLPAKWREGMGAKVFITPSTEGGLFVMSNEEFADLFQESPSINATPEEQQEFKKYLEYNSEPSSMDGQGRISLNESLLHQGGITTGEEIVLKLRERGIEVFSKQRWSQVRDSAKPSFLKVGRQRGI